MDFSSDSPSRSWLSEGQAVAPRQGREAYGQHRSRTRPDRQGRALLLLGLFLVCLPVSTLATPRVIEQRGDLRADVLSRLSFPRSDKLYRIPTQRDLQEWRRAVEAMLQGDLAGAAQSLGAIAPSYKVVRYTDASTEEPRVYHLLVEADLTPTGIVPTVVVGWGTYVFDPAARRELSIQVPHPRADRFTEDQGVDGFLQLRARSLLLAGTHRCASETESACDGLTTACGSPAAPFRISDPSHGARACDPTIANPFQVVHEAVFLIIPQTVALQLHGNSALACAGLHVLLSNSGSDFRVATNGNIERLMQRLIANGDAALNVQACGPVLGACNLCGTTNVQGRWTNGSTANACRVAAPAKAGEQFIHIEQNPAMRSDRGNRQRLIQAISTTIFVQEDATLMP
jgi:hypothetical protein